MSRVLVTGANGFIGSNLCRWLLERGWTVDGLVRESSDLHFLEGLDVRLIRGDLRSVGRIDLPRETEYVVHAAALVSDMAGGEACSRNIFDITKGLVRRIRAMGLELKRFVYISTALTLGLNDIGISEERRGRSAFGLPYVLHKIRAENELRDEHAQRGFPAVILRPGDVYGPNDRVTCAKVLEAAEKGIPLVAGRGRWRFGYCYVTNLCQAVERALVTPAVEGRAFTVTNSRLPTWGQFFRAMQAGVGRAQKIYFPVALARVLALALGAARAVAPGLKLELNPYRIRRVINETTYDISETVAGLGYEPDDDLDRQFAEIVAWYKKEKADGGLA